jgi:HAE1 family hydrophobic/amphiphilic exporter-1
VAITGVSMLDNMAQLANAGVAFVVLDDWASAAAKGQDIRSIAQSLQRATSGLQDGRVLIFGPPPIQGIGNASGFQMQVEQRDGSFDLGKLQSTTDEVIEQARTQTAIANPFTTFRAGAPHIELEVDRIKAESLNVAVGDVFGTLSPMSARPTSTASTSSA